MKKILYLIFFTLIVGCGSDKEDIIQIYPEGTYPGIQEEFGVSKEYEYKVFEDIDEVYFYKLTSDSVFVKLFKYSNKDNIVSISDTIKPQIIRLNFGESKTIRANVVYSINYVNNNQTDCLVLSLKDSSDYGYLYTKNYIRKSNNLEFERDVLFGINGDMSYVKSIKNGFLNKNHFYRIYNLDGSIYADTYTNLDLFNAYDLSINLFVDIRKESINSYNKLIVWNYNVLSQKEEEFVLYTWNEEQIKIKNLESRVQNNVFYVEFESISYEGDKEQHSYKIDIDTMKVI